MTSLPSCTCMLFALTLAAPLLAADEAPQVSPSLGLAVPAAFDPAQLPPLDGKSHPYARVEAPWDRVEAVEGSYEWSATTAAIDALAQAGFRPVLALSGTHAAYLPEGGVPSPLVGRSLEAWLAFVRSAARTFAGRIAVLEIGGAARPLAAEDYDTYALMLKQSALAARAEATAAGKPLRVAQQPVAAEALEQQRALWARDIGAYIDILPVQLGTGAPIDAWVRELPLHPPAPELWALVTDEEGGWNGIESAVAALTAGASVALAPAGADATPLVFGLALDAELSQGYGAAPLSGLSVESAPGVAWPGARVIGNFLRSSDLTSLLVLEVPPLPEGPAEARLVINLPSIRSVRTLDFGATGGHFLTLAPGGPAGRVFRLAPQADLQLVSFERRGSTKGLEDPQEKLQIATERRLTAEEIIARHQEHERVQNDRLERWTAQGRIDFHYKLPQAGSSVDVSIDSTWFWERGSQLEWEQTDYYINGNHVNWKSIPEVPLIQPEKVMTLPLDLTLDKTYAYRLVGDDRVDGALTYELEFQPSNPDSKSSLYRGRVWIDQQSFVRRKAVVIQTGLEPPVVSNEEIDHYEERIGADQQPYQMLVRIEGQQNWVVAGLSLAVRREVRFNEVQINPERGAFDTRRKEAYASTHQMLRDTEHGLRYLEHAPDGGRTVKEKMDTSRLFAAAGAFKDQSQDSVVPLAGVNYLNFDLGGRGIQFNALFAGVFALVTASKPDLFHKKIDATADAALLALRGDDRVYEASTERLEERIRQRSQNFDLRLGLPVGSFFKVNLIGRLTLSDYFHSDDGSAAIDAFNTAPQPAGTALEFVLPQDHAEIGAQLQLELNRRGWSFSGHATRTRRSSWEAWGLHDTTTDQFGHLDSTGAFVAGGTDPLHESYTRWGLNGSKEWYLPKFQKIRTSANWLGGSDLDRFSRYEFSFFGQDRLNGFSGSGVRFDRGTIGRLGYGFNLFEAIHFDASVETAWVKLEDSPDGTQTFTGLGLSGTVVGPWKTVINASYGYALSSDIPELEGDQEFMLIVLKLF
jgi:hypothetical protein